MRLVKKYERSFRFAIREWTCVAGNIKVNQNKHYAFSGIILLVKWISLNYSDQGKVNFFNCVSNSVFLFG